VNGIGTQTTEGTGLKTPSISGAPTMNTLSMIKKQIDKQSALHNAQISHTAYRGVAYDVNCDAIKETHGTYCYRGHVYNKWITTHIMMMIWTKTADHQHVINSSIEE